MPYHSSANLPIPNRERNEGGELEVVSHWYPQRPRSAAPSILRREWQPPEQWQPIEEVEDDKPSEYSQSYSQSRRGRSESSYEPRRHTVRNVPQRRICGMRLSTFILTCAVAFLFVGVSVAAALLGHKVANIEVALPSLVAQKARGHTEPAWTGQNSDSDGTGISGNALRDDISIAYTDETLYTNTETSLDATAEVTNVSRIASSTASTLSTRQGSENTSSTRRSETTDRNESTPQIETTRQVEIQTSPTRHNQENHTPDESEGRPIQTAPPKSQDEGYVEAPQPTKPTSPASPAQTGSASVGIEGWYHLGCYHDSKDNRILVGGITAREDMTNSVCAEICPDLKYKYFGTENKNECMCGETARGRNSVVPGKCEDRCSGTPPDQQFESCGGFWYMNLWERK